MLRGRTYLLFIPDGYVNLTSIDDSPSKNQALCKYRVHVNSYINFCGNLMWSISVFIIKGHLRTDSSLRNT